MPGAPYVDFWACCSGLFNRNFDGHLVFMIITLTAFCIRGAELVRATQPHTFLSKEDIQRAVAADGRSSGGSESDGSDSDSSSDSSSFVKQQKPDSEAEDTKEGKRKGPKAKCQPAPKRRRSVKGPPDRPEKDERIGQSLASHGKTADLIVELKPADIWRSVVRAAEVDRRMSKVLQPRKICSSCGHLTRCQKWSRSKLMIWTPR